MTKFQVTLTDLRKARACFEGHNKLVRGLQKKEFSIADENRESYIKFSYKETISLVFIAENNGLDDALWASRCIVNSNKDRDLRLFAVWCARQVEPLIIDTCSLNAIQVAERNADGLATDLELSAAWDAAWDAARCAAWDAAWDAARCAARDAARDAAWDAAWGAARDAARCAAWDAAIEKQKEMFIKMCNGQAPWQAGETE